MTISACDDNHKAIPFCFVIKVDKSSVSKKMSSNF
jgi:hypothetical protein